MILYIDENLPPVLVEAFSLLQSKLLPSKKYGFGLELRSIKKEFGQGAKDEDWVPLAGKDKAFVLTQDYNIQRISHQKELCEKFKLGMFYFRPPSKTGFDYWSIVKLFVKHWPELLTIIKKEKGPFAYKVTSNSKGFEKV
ncbi:MAG: hypothetical protein KDB74_00600 [Flavobacteriales bacterium]|nr:hypothetical protein [Flavobacteriales bacterium]